MRHQLANYAFTIMINHIEPISAILGGAILGLLLRLEQSIQIGSLRHHGGWETQYTCKCGSPMMVVTYGYYGIHRRKGILQYDCTKCPLIYVWGNGKWPCKQRFGVWHWRNRTYTALHKVKG
jgi:hypothetical protein